MPTATKKTTKKAAETKTDKTTVKDTSEKTENKSPASKTVKSGKYTYANGKRKTAVARVRLYKGVGDITINDKPVDKYLTIKGLKSLIKFPFKITGTNKKYDVTVIVKGGGPHSQAEAIRHGIAKGLTLLDPLLRPALKKAGMLTRDSRTKERKKFGLKRARKAPQFSKR